MTSITVSDIEVAATPSQVRLSSETSIQMRRIVCLTTPKASQVQTIRAAHNTTVCLAKLHQNTTHQGPQSLTNSAGPHRSPGPAQPRPRKATR